MITDILIIIKEGYKTFQKVIPLLKRHLKFMKSDFGLIKQLDKAEGKESILSDNKQSPNTKEDPYDSLIIERNKLLIEYHTLINRVKELEDQNIHSSLSRFKTFIDTLPKTQIYYDYGKGSKRVNTILQTSLLDKDIIMDFILTDLSLAKEDWDSADVIILGVSKAISTKYPTTRYYASDISVYKVKEYWATAKETIQKLWTQNSNAFDCDDIMVLKFCCIYLLLEESFPNDLWRLRGFVVKLWANGIHAMLGWVDKDKCDWIPIETTFLDIFQEKISEYKIRNQLFYQIKYSFDLENEYIKI